MAEHRTTFPGEVTAASTSGSHSTLPTSPAYGFILDASRSAMQALVDELLAPATQGKVKYTVVGSAALVTFFDAARCVSDVDVVGFLPSRECAFWVPLLRAGRAANFPIGSFCGRLTSSSTTISDWPPGGRSGAGPRRSPASLWRPMRRRRQPGSPARRPSYGRLARMSRRKSAAAQRRRHAADRRDSVRPGGTARGPVRAVRRLGCAVCGCVPDPSRAAGDRSETVSRLRQCDEGVLPGDRQFALPAHDDPQRGPADGRFHAVGDDLREPSDHAPTCSASRLTRRHTRCRCALAGAMGFDMAVETGSVIVSSS